MEGVFEGGGEGFVVALPVSVFCLVWGGEGRGGGGLRFDGDARTDGYLAWDIGGVEHEHARAGGHGVAEAEGRVLEPGGGLDEDVDVVGGGGGEVHGDGGVGFGDEEDRCGVDEGEEEEGQQPPCWGRHHGCRRLRCGGVVVVGREEEGLGDLEGMLGAMVFYSFFLSGTWRRRGCVLGGEDVGAYMVVVEVVIGRGSREAPVP